MKVLLIKPRSEAEQFGLAPFFQTEPLGLEYISTALESHKHITFMVDMRFEKRSVQNILKAVCPDIVGISCLHILDAPATLCLAKQIKAVDQSIFIVAGGHAVSAYPDAIIKSESVDAICIGEGEEVMPKLCDAIQAHRPLDGIPSLLLYEHGSFHSTGNNRESLDLQYVTLPDRSMAAAYQKHYCCLNYMPVWTIETTRGCSYRCKFCSVWQFYRSSCRFHPPAAVRTDFEATGNNLFVIDDLFWADKEQSRDLARCLLSSAERKNWILVQSRIDLVANNPELLELWRPLSNNFDIFFGFESPTMAGLNALNKGTDISKTSDAIRTARKLGYGVTGNFIIDPDFTEEDFVELWRFLDLHQLYRVGFTILTPLPGTHYFEEIKDRLCVFDWNQYDLHHLLWLPRLPIERFFELYCETWRRSVLNMAGRKKWWNWLKAVNPLQLPRLMKILARTQKLMDPKAYLNEFQIPSREKY